MRPTFPAATLAMTAALAVCHAAPLGAQERPKVPIPPDHYTKAELNAFRGTPSYEETIAFLRRLETTSPYLSLSFFGTTAEGRPMPLLVASKDKAFTPEAAAKSGRPVVLVLNGIHSGEPDGKDACLILLRDMALGNRPDLLDTLTLLVVPIYNADGHERISKWNRPNQDGPVEGMGFRTTTMGYDLNRDFLKADAPETRAFLSLVSAWSPDLFVDNHVTDGSDAQPTLTVSFGSEPATAKPLGDWLDAIVRPALADVEERGWKTSPYIEWLDPLDPARGIDLGPSTPRYGTGYMPLRSIPSILVENHALKPFGERVRANEAFLSALLARVGAAPKVLKDARAAALEAARSAPVGAPFVLDAVTDTSRPEKIDFPGFAWSEVVSPVTGRRRLVYDPTKPMSVPMPLYRHAKATVTAPRPAAYLVPAGWPRIEEKLAAHGIRFTKLDVPRTLPVGTYRASEAKLENAPYQGRVRVSARIAKAVETRTVPAGSLYVPLDDPLAPVAMHLLEPEGPDSLFAWGDLSSALEMKEYIDARVLDPLAEELLKKDPKLAAEWKAKLEDPQFAANARERYRFFYSRTPYWDESVGLLPVFRLDAGLADPPAAAKAETVAAP
jgi:hypothetical protein